MLDIETLENAQKDVSFTNQTILAMMIDWCAEANAEREHFLITYSIAKIVEENLIHLAEAKSISITRSNVFQENILIHVAY